jgi:hypothetical protein
MSDSGQIQDIPGSAPSATSSDNSSGNWRSVTAARIVVVGPTSGPGVASAIEELSLAAIGPVWRSDVTPSTGDHLWGLAQPHQLWLLTTDDGLASSITELGATVARAASGDQVRAAVLAWIDGRCRASEAAERNLLRENTILRRELNRALSVLGPTHQVLGLMPSVTIDQFRAERRPSAGLQPEDPHALMARRWHPIAAPEIQQLERELTELRDHVAAIERTRIMRWSRLPRSVYRRLRVSV